MKTTQTYTQWVRKHRRKVILSSIFGGLLICGVTVGVTYAIMNKNNPFVIKAKVNGNAVLKKVNDVASYKIEFSEKLDSQAVILISPDAEYSTLFSSLLVFQDQNGKTIPYEDSRGTIHISLNKGLKEFVVNAKLISQIPDDAGEGGVFHINLNLRSWFHGTSHENNVLLILDNENSTPYIDANKISGLDITGDEMINDDPWDALESFKSFLSSEFPNLPLLDEEDKLDLSTLSYFQMMDKLHQYDNSESLAANILSDYFCEFMDGNMSLKNFKMTKVHLIHIEHEPSWEVINGPRLFNISFLVDGGNNVGTDELNDTYFFDDHENWTNDWTIQWDQIYDIETGDQNYNQLGFANGLHRETQINYENDSEYRNLQLDILRQIYGGIVKVWPSFMQK